MNHAGEPSPDGFPVETMQLTGTGGEGMEWGVSPPTRSLAIVGSHPATRELAPYEDPDYEIWLFNEAAMKPEKYRRWDGLLQIHKPEVYSSLDNWVNKDHWEWLQQDHGPDKRIFMQDVDPRVPNSVKYPLDEILSLVPYKYLRSSPAMALALAIYLGYQHIALYGSELSSNTEYRYQAINYAFWIGFAHGRGIQLDMECWQSEFNQPIYGYEGELQLDKKFFELRFIENEILWKSKDKAYQKLQAKLDQAYLENKFAQVGELSVSLQDMAVKTGEAYGAMQESKYYMERKDHISRQEFERRAAQSQIDGEGLEADMHHESGKCEYVWNVWRQTGNYEARKQLQVFMDAKTDKAFEMGKRLGMFRENMHYQNEYDANVTAAGGERAVYQGLANL